MSAGMVAAEASKGMGLDEESFNVPVPVAQKVRASYLQLYIKYQILCHCAMFVE